MNYNEMTDFEINKRVASLYLPCDYIFDKDSKKVELVGVQTFLGAYGEPEERQIKWGEYDPCNNPADAWPIIVENNISIINDDTYQLATSSACESFEPHGNQVFEYPVTDRCGFLRAAMIVYLMMKEDDV